MGRFGIISTSPINPKKIHNLDSHRNPYFAPTKMYNTNSNDDRAPAYSDLYGSASNTVSNETLIAFSIQVKRIAKGSSRQAHMFISVSPSISLPALYQTVLSALVAEFESTKPRMISSKSSVCCLKIHWGQKGANSYGQVLFPQTTTLNENKLSSVLRFLDKRGGYDSVEVVLSP